jgi:hypothetical protein
VPRDGVLEPAAPAECARFPWRVPRNLESRRVLPEPPPPDDPPVAEEEPPVAEDEPPADGVIPAPNAGGFAEPEPPEE